jgi:hypothetical protein
MRDGIAGAGARSRWRHFQKGQVTSTARVFKAVVAHLSAADIYRTVIERPRKDEIEDGGKLY